jgi:hypothetical protein
MNSEIFARIRGLFDRPQIQNNLRGLWVEAMVCEILGDGWEHTGKDWSAWDVERSDGLRVEIKQSAREQSWGIATSSPRFDISAAKGHYPDGKTYVENVSGLRFADVYIFAWHDGADQRDISQWAFYVVEEKKLPVGRKSLSLQAIRKLASPQTAETLGAAMARIHR